MAIVPATMALAPAPSVVPSAIVPAQGALPCTSGPTNGAIGAFIVPAVNASTNQTQGLGWSLQQTGGLDFDPIGGFFQGTTNATMGMVQRVANSAGHFEDKNMQIRTNAQGKVLEHFTEISGGESQQNISQKHMRYANVSSGVMRQAHERSFGEKAVRQVFEANKLTGEERSTELVRGMEKGNASVSEFDALWSGQANVAGVRVYSDATVALPGHLQFAPLSNGQNILTPSQTPKTQIQAPPAAPVQQTAMQALPSTVAQSQQQFAIRGQAVAAPPASYSSTTTAAQVQKMAALELQTGPAVRGLTMASPSNQTITTAAPTQIKGTVGAQTTIAAPAPMTRAGAQSVTSTGPAFTVTA